MNRKKTLWYIFVFIAGIAIVAGSVWGIKRWLRERDPRWQAAKEIYTVQTALQKVDENWKLESLSEVRPYEIKRPDGPSIYYYCCITGYLTEEPGELNGLNKAAISLVVDVDSLENCRDYEVGGQDAVMGELDGQTYLCWTISPKYSCVMEYTAGTVTEEDVFRMAESVGGVK